MINITRTTTTLLIVTGLVALSGCASQSNRPISTSLSDLTAEAIRRRTSDANYSEVISLSGMLMAPTTGSVYHYPDRSLLQKLIPGGEHNLPPPSFMLGVSEVPADKSFRLVMETAEPPEMEAAVTNVVACLEKIQDHTRDAIQYTLRLAAIDAQLNSTNLNTDLKTTLTSERDKVVTLQLTNDVNLAAARSKLRTATSIPGIIVARWSKASESGARGGLGKPLSASYEAGNAQSGYVILGGYRVSLLHLGRDFLAYIRNMDTGSYRLFREKGCMVSYLLQSKYVAWTSDLDLKSSFAIEADVNLRNIQNTLSEIDRLKISAYIREAISLSSVGVAGKVTWSKEAIDLIGHQDEDGTWTAITNGLTLGDLYEINNHPEDNYHARPSSQFGLSAEKSTGTITELEDWKSVQAVFIRPPAFLDLIRADPPQWFRPVARIKWWFVNYKLREDYERQKRAQKSVKSS